MYQHQYSRTVLVLVEHCLMASWVLLLLGQGKVRAAKGEERESENHN
jgi:hypothetical protein